MTLREAEIGTRRRSFRNKHPTEAHEHPDRVLPFLAWCQLNGFSKATGRRVIKRGEIAVLQLSPRRIGIKESENRRWQASREIAR